MFKTKANSEVRCWATTDKLDYVDGSHDGYQRLSDPVTHRRRVCFAKKAGFWLVLDELTAKSEHHYDQYFHFGPGADVSKSDLTVTATYKNGAGVVVKPLMTDGLKLKQFNGSTDPIQGWVSYDYAVKVPAEAIKYSKPAKGNTSLATLLVPFKENAPDCSVEVLDQNIFKVKHGDGSYLIIFSDGSEKTYGDFTFDGELLCAKFDAQDQLIECNGVKTSQIVYQGKTLLDSVVRHKVDSDISV
jgi:hypothetical protein